MSETADRPLKLETEEFDSGILVRVCGSVSIHDANVLRKQLEDIALRKPPILVLDLSEMDFICSMGLGAIILAHVRNRHHNGQIRLVNPQTPVQELLEITRLTELLSIYPSVAEATAP